MAWHLAPALVRLNAEINALWPGRDRSSDGSIGDVAHSGRASDHNPDPSAGGIVRALDIDEDLVAGLTHVGEAMPLVNQIIQDPRVAYVIYEGQIWQNPSAFSRGGWLPYNGVNAHRHHVHVSVRRGPRWDSDARPWGITTLTSNGGASLPSVPSTPVPTAPSPIAPLGENMAEARVRRSDGSIFYARIDSAGGAFVGLDVTANTAVDRLGIPITRNDLSRREVQEIRQAVIDLSKHRIDPA